MLTTLRNAWFLRGLAAALAVLSMGCPGGTCIETYASLSESPASPGQLFVRDSRGSIDVDVGGATRLDESFAFAGSDRLLVEGEASDVDLTYRVDIRTSIEGLDVLLDFRASDPRNWDNGLLAPTREFAGPDGGDPGQVRVQFPDTCEDCPRCWAVFDGLELEVLEARGERRPLPELVSPEFVRVLRVRIEHDGPIVGRQVTEPPRANCERTIESVQFQGEFRHSASDFGIDEVLCDAH